MPARVTRIPPARRAGLGMPAASGLTAQPLPDRPRRGRTRLPARRTAQQREAAAQELGTTWPSLHKAFSDTGWACPPATPKPSAGGPSPPARQRNGQPATRPWTRCLWPSTWAPSRLGNGHRPSWLSGSAARSVRQPWRECGGRAEQRKPRPPAHRLGLGLGDHPSDRPQPAAGRPAHQPARTPPRQPGQPPRPPTTPRRKMAADAH